jgi:hypothetical protein
MDMSLALAVRVELCWEVVIPYPGVLENDLSRGKVRAISIEVIPSVHKYYYCPLRREIKGDFISGWHTTEKPNWIGRG